MKIKKKCATCNKILLKAHANRKRCEPCAKKLRVKPAGTLTKSQIRKVTSWIGKKPISEMAKDLNTSVSNIKRSMRGTSIWFHNGKWENRPDLLKKVYAFYRSNDKTKTIKKFPDVNIKAVLDRPEYYGFKKHGKQVRWTSEQIIEAVKMHGLVSHAAQAKFFNRPGAFEGSIKSLIEKRLNAASGLNGLAKWNAQHLVNCEAKYLKPIGNARDGRQVEFINLILWVDVEKHLKPCIPESIKEGVSSMADFQRWIWNSKNPKPLIIKMMKERERA